MNSWRCEVCRGRRPIVGRGEPYCRPCRTALSRALASASPATNTLAYRARREITDPIPGVRAHGGHQLREIILRARQTERAIALVLRAGLPDAAAERAWLRAHVTRRKARAELFARGFALPAALAILSFFGPDGLPDDNALVAWLARERGDQDPGVADGDGWDDDDEPPDGDGEASWPEVLDREFGCGHPRTELRMMVINRRGATGVRRQCLNCYQSIETVAKEQVPRRGAALQPFEAAECAAWKARYEARQQELWNQDHAARQAAWARRNEDWWAAYDEYLASAAWARKRQLVLDRDGWQCQSQASPSCRGDARQVHHLSYAHLRAEPLWELVAVCIPCHEALTEMDRANRSRR